MTKLTDDVATSSYRIGCGANDRLLQQTVGQIVDISANTTWQYLEMGLKTELNN